MNLRVHNDVKTSGERIDRGHSADIDIDGDEAMDPTGGSSSVPLLLSVVDAARALGIGRSKIYELIKNDEVEVVHIGRSCRVPVAALHDYVDRLRLIRQPVGAGRPRRRLRDAAAPRERRSDVRRRA